MQNQKAVFLFLCAFLVMGMMFNFPVIFAAERDGDSGSVSDSAITADNSGSSENAETASDDSEDEEVEIEDEVEDESEDEDEIEERAREKREFKSEFRDENGRKVKIEKKVEIDGNKVKIKIVKIVVDEFGNEKKIEIEIERENGRRTVRVDGEDELETELEIEQGENDSELRAVLSNGERARLRLLPDEARERILERLKALNIENMTLEEITDRNVPKVVYNIKTNKQGKFLGVFKLAMKVEGRVDPETGEILDINKPWWAILVAGEDDADEGFVESETEVADETPVIEEENATETFLENTTSNESDIAA